MPWRGGAGGAAQPPPQERALYIDAFRGLMALVMVQGLTPGHDVPAGWERRMAVTYGMPLARHFIVYSVNRKRGLAPGESMSDIARHLVNAIEHDVGGPVLLQGSSTGGSVVLQLAADRPDLVRRLVTNALALPEAIGESVSVRAE